MSHVLVIDDNPKVRSSMKAMLESFGFDVSVARDGDEGLQHFRLEPFDLVISDIIMPNKDGFETVRELREITDDVPIIVMSGGSRIAADDIARQATRDALELAEFLGATRTISKPFSQDDLLKVIRECLVEKGTKLLG
jgi:CheY-like chemotaxis protein